MFTERLREYRKDKGLSKVQFARKLKISESYYNMIENRKRNPSKSFLKKLVAESSKPEEYWIYGVGISKDFKNSLSLQCLERAISQIIDLGLIKDVDKLFNGNYTEGTLEELLIVALKTDIKFFFKKDK